MAQSLAYYPHRGAKEMWLAGLKHEYRFLLFNRTKRTDIKIIYYIQENETKVYVTDFFPTEKDVKTMAARST
ncbi:MAG: hypothetical protein ACMVP2_07090 [Imperialibacter sp.]|uniref:hypothetical protein n=1 Tax=Imperialibacter sp. TaxID=2038411 RepID=UPI003A88BF43